MRGPLLVLIVLLALGAASLAWSASALPPQVASHFNSQGEPNGWCDRGQYVLIMTAIGLFVPLLLMGVAFLPRVFPAGMNLPNGDYWLAPERQKESADYIGSRLAWLACMAVVLLIAVNCEVVQANRRVPVHASNLVLGLLVGVFLAATLAVTTAMIVHFSQVPSGPRRQNDHHTA